MLKRLPARCSLDDVVDTIIVMATGYRTKSIVITSLDDQNLNITLKSNDEKMTRPPVVVAESHWGPSVDPANTILQALEGTPKMGRFLFVDKQR